jgi:hypothetical protein
VKWLLAISLLGCGEKKQVPPTPTGAPEVPRSDMPREFAVWMTKDAVAAWQGSYVTKLALRDPLDSEDVVLDVKGESAKGFDGKVEYPLGFAILAPCIAGFEQARTEGAMAGNTLTHAKQFLIKDGKLIAAEGTVGMRKGRAAITCTYGPDPVVTLDDQGVCKAWNRDPDWKSTPVTCRWTKSEDGKDVLTIGDGAGAPTLIADGDLLMDRGFEMQLERGWHTRHASYDAAKQALSAKSK